MRAVAFCLGPCSIATSAVTLPRSTISPPSPLPSSMMIFKCVYLLLCAVAVVAAVAVAASGDAAVG